jgi:hypothetical protein
VAHRSSARSTRRSPPSRRPIRSPTRQPASHPRAQAGTRRPYLQHHSAQPWAQQRKRLFPIRQNFRPYRATRLMSLSELTGSSAIPADESKSHSTTMCTTTFFTTTLCNHVRIHASITFRKPVFQLVSIYLFSQHYVSDGVCPGSTHLHGISRGGRFAFARRV